MASQIKRLSKFPTETIAKAIKSVLKDETERKDFIVILEKMVKFLKVHNRQDSNSLEIFDNSAFNRIISQIRDKLTEYEEMELQGKDLVWDVKLKYGKAFDKMTIEEMRNMHQKIVTEELNAGSLDLIVKFQRGMLYIVAYEKAQTDNYKKWIKEEFGVVYFTALKYMTFSRLLKRYPRLIVCGLTFSQLYKYNKRLYKFINKNEELKSKLSESIYFSLCPVCSCVGILEHNTRKWHHMCCQNVVTIVLTCDKPVDHIEDAIHHERPSTKTVMLNNDVMEPFIPSMPHSAPPVMEI